MFTFKDTKKISKQLGMSNRSRLTKRKRAMLEADLERKMNVVIDTFSKYWDEPGVFGDSTNQWGYLINAASSLNNKVEFEDDQWIQIKPWDVMVDGFFGTLYAGVTFPHPFVVIINLSWNDDSVSGDAIFAYKTALYIRHAFPRSQVYILTNPTMKRWLISHTEINQIGSVTDSLDGIFPWGWNSQRDLVILDVATPSGNHLDIRDRYGRTIVPKYIHIDEYNGWRISHSTGCHAWMAAGVGFDNSGRLCGGIHTEKLPIFHLLDLGARVLLNKLPGRFYIGYNSKGDTSDLANVYLDNFFQIIVGYEKENTDDYNIVVVERNRDRWSTRKCFLERNCQTLEKWNCHIEVHCGGSIQDSRPPKGILTRSTSRRVRVLFLDSLCHSDMLWMMKKSEPLVLVSGDQSLAEAVTYDKIVVSYQRQPWKQDLVDNLVNFVSYHFPGSLFETLFQMVFGAKDNSKLGDVIRYLKMKWIRRDIPEFNHILRERWNFFRQLKGVINCALWDDYPEIKKFSKVPVRELAPKLMKYHQKLQDTIDRPAKKLRRFKNSVAKNNGRQNPRSC